MLGLRVKSNRGSLYEQIFKITGHKLIIAKQSGIQTLCLRIVHQAINGLIQRQYQKQSGQKIRAKNLKCGAVTIVQRFGDGLRLNPHFHMLFLEGVYVLDPKNFQDGKPRFYPTPAPTDEEIAQLVATIAKRVIRALKRRGYLQDETDSVQYEEENSQEELFTQFQAASVHQMITLGDRKGQKIRQMGVPIDPFQPTPKGPRCAQAAGFSLHANVSVQAHERDRLEKLARYIARNAVAEDRLSLSPDHKQITYRLKRRYTDGTTHLLFTPLELMEKLAALVPPPRAHLTRYFGILGPHDKHRSQVVPKPPPKKEETPTTSSDTPESPFATRKRMSWAQLLKRVFNIDVEICPDCDGKLNIIAAIQDSDVIQKILKHLKLPHQPPTIHPARAPPQAEFDFDQSL